MKHTNAMVNCVQSQLRYRSVFVALLIFTVVLLVPKDHFAAEPVKAEPLLVEQGMTEGGVIEPVVLEPTQMEPAIVEARLEEPSLGLTKGVAKVERAISEHMQLVVIENGIGIEQIIQASESEAQVLDLQSGFTIECSARFNSECKIVINESF